MSAISDNADTLIEAVHDAVAAKKVTDARLAAATSEMSAATAAAGASDNAVHAAIEALDDALKNGTA